MCCLLASAGCSGFTPWHKPSSTLPKTYRSAAIEYQIDAGRLGEPLSVAVLDGRLVHYCQNDSPPVPGVSLGRLSVECPHPDGRDDAALATVTIQRREHLGNHCDTEGRAWTTWAGNLGRGISHRTTPLASHEVWQLDLPRSDVDYLLAALEHDGFFVATDRHAPAVEMKVQVDRQKWQTGWQPQPQLDALMRHVRSAGQLVEHRQRPEALVLREGPAKSVIAWHDSLPPGLRQRAAEQYVAAAPGFYAPTSTGALQSPVGLITRLPVAD